MRVAVISDVHGNLPALQAVMQDIGRWDPDQVWCLGDIVGYGPQPNRCVDEARSRSNLCLLGNHDLAAIGQVDLATFSPIFAVPSNQDGVGLTAGDFVPGTVNLASGQDGSAPTL